MPNQYIYRVFDNDKNIELEYYLDITKAFKEAEKYIFEKHHENFILDSTSHMFSWYENDEGRWECWIITKSQYVHQEFKAELLEVEVQPIEVFG